MQSPGRKEDMLDPIAELFRRVDQLERTRFNTVEDTDVTAHAALILGAHGVPGIMAAGQGLVWNGSDWDATTYALASDLSTLALSALLDGDPAGGVLSGTYPNPGFAASLVFPGVARVGSNVPVSSALLAAIQGGNDFEFGHSNAAGYRSTLGSYSSSGHPFLAFSGEHGTTANTFRTRGIAASIMRSDLAGGFVFGNAPLTNADNQALAALLVLANTGAVSFKNGVWHNSYDDGKDRFHFTANGNSYWKTAAAHIWRNGSDGDIMTLSSLGLLGLTTAYDTTYTPDGLFDATARLAIDISTLGGGRLKFGYQDTGDGFYAPAIGFLIPALSTTARRQTKVMRGLVSGEAYNRWAFTAEGGLMFGPGTAPVDVYLKRVAAGLLGVRSIDDTFYQSFIMAGCYPQSELIPPLKSASTPTAGEIFYDTTTGKHKVRDGVAAVDKALLREGDVTGANPAAARAYRSAAYSLSDNVWTKIPLDTLENSLNNDAMWDSTNSRFVVKTAGVYELAGNLKTGSGTGGGAYRLVAVAVNGAIRALQRDQPQAQGNMMNCATGALSLNAGDAIELWGYQAQGSALPLALTDNSAGVAGNVVWLSAVRISPYDSRSSSIIIAAGSRTNTAYGDLSNGPDQATVNVPTNGIIEVAFVGQWQNTVSGAGRAALFVDGVQQQVQRAGGTDGYDEIAARGTGTDYAGIFSEAWGLVSGNPFAGMPADLPTTGIILGSYNAFYAALGAAETSVGSDQLTGGTQIPTGDKAIIVGLPAGSHTVSVKWKATSGTVNARARRLYVEAKGY